MILALGILLFMVFLFLSGLHLYWGFGGRWERDVVVPSNEKGEIVLKPRAIDCFIVGLVLLGFGLFVLVKVDLVHVLLPLWLMDYLLWIISLIFVLRATGDFKYVGFFKKIKNTPFGISDTKYFSPLCLLIGVAGIIIELFY
jgi:hypothetical protein